MEFLTLQHHVKGTGIDYMEDYSYSSNVALVMFCAEQIC